MFNHPLALEQAYNAVEEAIRLGASYADARYEYHQREEVRTSNGRLAQAHVSHIRGMGVRVLVRGAWGFVSVSEPTRHDVALAARRAVDLARAAAVVQDRSVELVEQPPQRALYRTPIKRDPLAVPLEDKVNLLLSIDERLSAVSGVVLAEGRFNAHRRRKIFVSSEGSELDQELVATGIGYLAGASDGHDLQIRSYPFGAGGQCFGRGWEMVAELNLLDHAERVANEAVELLKAPACPHQVGSAILTASQAAAQIHATAAQVLELDRVLGHDESENGRSFLTTEKLGNFVLGDSAFNLVADAREIGGAGTFGYDDEGVEAQRIDLVSDGRFTGYLSSRETARQVGLEHSSGALRAGSYGTPPVVRLTNLALVPGKSGDLEGLISDTKSGVLFDAPRAVSIDETGSHFLAVAEAAWEIRDGRRGRILKNPTYQASTATFWQSMDGLGGPGSSAHFGVARSRKGHPIQIVPIGLSAVPCRFHDVVIGGQHKAFERLPEHISAALSPSDIGGMSTLPPRKGRKSSLPKKKGKKGARKRDTK